MSLAATMLSTGVERGFGHTPHDQITHVAVSPEFATDHTIFTVSDGRPLRSTDGGAHWVEMARGLAGEPVAHFAISPSEPRVVYLSTRGSGVFRSTDQGLSWTATNARRTPADIAELAVSPTSSDVVVAAGGLFSGLFRTVDGGANWAPVRGIGKVNAVQFVPARRGRVVIGAANGSILVSDDNGATFDAVAKSAGGAEITSLTVGSQPSESTQSTMLAGTSAGEVLVSKNAGDSWTKVGPGLPSQRINSLALSLDYANDKTIWASTALKGAYRSTDDGETWTAQAQGLTTDPQAADLRLPDFQAIAVTAESSDRQVLYLVSYDGLFKSVDLGARWTPVETVAEYVTGLAISPNYAKDGTVVVSTYVKGVYVSRDKGRSFVASNAGLSQKLNDGNKLLPVRRMHNVVFSPEYATDQTIFTATWDRFVRSGDGGRTWNPIVVAPQLKTGGNLRQFVIAVSPGYRTDRTIYLGTRQGNVYRSTKSGGPRSWTGVSNLRASVRSLVISPDYAKDRTLFAGTVDGVFTSSDAGTTWTATGPKSIALLAISPDYAQDRTLFAGTEAGLSVTRDGGATWATVTAAPLSAASKIAAVAVSPDFANDKTVLLSIAGVGLFRSTDAGATFVAVGASLLERGLVIDDFENPTSAPIQFSASFATDRTIYAYAQQSAVRSTDAGDTWEVLDIPTAAKFDVPEGSSPTTAPSANDASDGGDGSPVVVIAIVGVVLVGAGGAFAVARRRRHSRGAQTM